MNETPDWFATGKTVLIMKDRKKENDIPNLRPTTCLPLMWKAFTGILMNCFTICKNKECCKRNKISTKENQGEQRINC